MQDNQSDSYDQTKIETLKIQLQTSKSELLLLAYNQDQINDKIDTLNAQGCNCIQQQLFYQAMVYLQEAQKILEYAAGCGRTIDRSLIVATLHNQATVYQRMWQLVRSADYIQAIIFNINTFLSNQPKLPLTLANSNLQSQEHSKMAIYLGNKLSLITYLLQFCAVSSQIKNHNTALTSAQKALTLLKTYCEQLYQYQKVVGCKATTDFQRNLLQQLQNIRDFRNESLHELDSYIQKLLSKATKSIIIFQKKTEWAAQGLSKPQEKQLQLFSLGQLMQVSPLTLKKVQQKLDLQIQLTLIKKIYKAIYISITHFTIATELRLIANQKYGIESSFKKESKQFKQSQIHHLVAVITVALYVPCYTKYFQHILKSFTNHYQIDLTQAQSYSQSQDHAEDLVHLQIQSISQKSSNIPKQKQKQRDRLLQAIARDKFVRKTDYPFQKQKPLNKTHQQFNTYSAESSQSSKIKDLNKTSLAYKQKSPQKSRKKSKSNKKSQHTQRQKRIIIVSKVTKSQSKNKNDQKTRKSKSARKMHEESQQKVVHYFHYDSKQVVRKTNQNHNNHQKQGKVAGVKSKGKVVRDKKSPQNPVISNQLKKLKLFTQSTKNLNPPPQPRKTKKFKSPQPNTSALPISKRQK